MSQSVSGNWNSELLEQNYQRWKEDTSSVTPEWNAFFEGFELGLTQSEELAEGARAAVPEDAALERRADSLAYSYRTLGHTIARLDPLTPEPPVNPLLSLKAIGFTDSDLEIQVLHRRDSGVFFGQSFNLDHGTGPAPPWIRPGWRVIYAAPKRPRQERP